MAMDDSSEIQWESTSIPEEGPRAVRTTTSAVLGRICLIVLMGITLIFGSMSGYQAVTRLDKLRVAGKVIQGQVDDLTKQSSKSGATYRVTYSFTINNQSVEGSGTVSNSESQLYNIGGPITVTVLQDGPSNNRIGTVDADQVDGLKGNWILGTTVVFGILVFILVCVELIRIDQGKMLINYRAVPVHIVSIGPPSNDRAPIRELSYRIRFPDGSVETRADRLDSSVALKFNEGEFSTALIDPNDRSKLRLLKTITMVECA